MIRSMNKDDLTFITEWLEKQNAYDQHYIAWVESEKAYIDEQLRPILNEEAPHAWISYDPHHQVNGFLAIEPFEDGAGRLLGPFATGENAVHVLNQLWDYASPTLESLYTTVKVAFFEQNEELVQFCEREGFQRYNREKNLVLEKPASIEPVHNDKIQPYQGDVEKLKSLHPRAAFFSAEEMTQLIQDPHFHLWCYVEGNELRGYLFYEQIEGTEEGEICFLQVEDHEQGRGIGTQLIQHACYQAFTEQGQSFVTVPVRSSNPQAEKLYKELGFREHTTIVAYSKSWKR